MTIIAVFLFPRRFWQYAILCVKPTAYGIPFSALCHGDYMLLWAELWFVVVCRCLNRGCAKKVLRKLLPRRNHNSGNIMRRPDNYNNFFLVFLTFAGPLPQVLRYYTYCSALGIGGTMERNLHTRNKHRLRKRAVLAKARTAQRPPQLTGPRRAKIERELPYPTLSPPQKIERSRSHSRPHSQY